MKVLKSLEITEEEKNALMEYCGWRYTYINLLTSGSIEAINNLDNISLNTFSEEHFNYSMEVIKNVYSAICKYSYDTDSSKLWLYRGTTESELKYVQRNNGIYNKLISTSLQENVALQHAGDKFIAPDQDPSKKVVLRLKLRDKHIPYINVNDVLGEETNFMEEEEVVLSPFCRLEEVKHESSWKGIEYYGAYVKEPQLDKIANQNELKQQIAEKIGDIPGLVKEYLDNMVLYHKYDNIKSSKEYEKAEPARQQARANAKSALDKFNDIRKNIILYVKSMCANTKEQIYENAIDEQTQDNKINLEEIKLKQKESINKKIQRVDMCIREIDKNSKYEILARKLGIDWNIGILKDEIDDKFSEYISKCANMIETIDETEASNAMSIDTQIDVLLKSKQKIDNMNKFIKIMESQVSFFSEENCDNHIKVLLNQKVDDLIKKAQIRDIDKKMNDLDKQKPGLFGLITGKAKEVELKKEQLSLNKELMELNSYKDEGVYSAEEIMAKIIAYGRENEGNLTPELSDMVFRINNTLPLDATKLQKLVDEKTEQKSLILVEDEKLSRRKLNVKLGETNDSIRKEIEYQKSNEAVKYRNSSKITTQVTDVPQMVYESLRKTIEATEDRDFAQNIWKMMEEESN